MVACRFAAMRIWPAQISVEREWHKVEVVDEFFFAITVRRSVFSDGEPDYDLLLFVGQEPIAAADFR
jgi:hypothetical protein